MRTTSVLVVFLLIPLLVLPGCGVFQQQSLQSDLTVLKTQLARQQSQMAAQQVLLQALMTGQQKQEEEQTQQLTAIQSQLGELVQVARSEPEQDSAAATNTGRVINSESNGQPGMNLTIIGQVEVIHLQPPGRNLVARIDTGANTSSLDARDIEMFESDGEDFVRFKLPQTMLAEGQQEQYELPVSRFVRIIQSGEEEERRAVIELKIRLGSVERMAEFTLADRENLTYHVLIGRNILRDFFAVDVANKFIISDKDSSDETDGASGDSDEDATEEEATDDEEVEDGNG
jgi:hypothetical protein